MDRCGSWSNLELVYQLGGTLIRPVGADDLESTRRWRSDPLISGPALGRRFPTTDAGERAWFEHLNEGAFPTHVVWAVADSESSIVGLVRLTDINWIHRTSSFGVWIGPEHWGQGHASRATQLACDRGFLDLGLRQIRLSVVSGEQAALAVYKRNGFIDEGVQRGAVLLDGIPTDLILMVLSSDVWSRLHGER